MTDLNRRISRRALDPHPRVGRRIVVSLLPQGLIQLHEEKRRLKVSIEIDELYTLLIKRYADNERSRKMKARAERRKSKLLL
jgi:hypothetical protein